MTSPLAQQVSDSGQDAQGCLNTWVEGFLRLELAGQGGSAEAACTRWKAWGSLQAQTPHSWEQGCQRKGHLVHKEHEEEGGSSSLAALRESGPARTKGPRLDKARGCHFKARLSVFLR